MLSAARALLPCLLLLTACGSAPAAVAPAQQRPGAADVAGWPTFVLDDAGAIVVPAAATVAPADVALPAVDTATPLAVRWLQPALDAVAAREKDPPASSRAYAYVAVALHDAVVAAAHWQLEHGRAAAPAYPATETTLAAAAAEVLAALFPEVQVARLRALAAAEGALAVTSGHADDAGAAAGLALGRAVGEAVVARAAQDGYDDVWGGELPAFAGAWEPPPGSVALPTQPLAGTWDTWVLPSGDAVRPEPPPAYGSDAYLEECRELVALREGLTAEQESTASRWAGGEGTSLPAGLWNELIFARVGQLSTPEQVRLLALVNVAMADAGVAAWDAKYTWWTVRPENAIRALGVARGWQPLLVTPAFPAYVSGHATYSGAAAEVLASLDPDAAEEYRAQAEEAAESRLLGGIHFRSDSTAGLAMGEEIGRMVVAWWQEHVPA